MTAVIFDSHKVARTLKEGGFDEKQVDAQVEAHMQVTQGFVTKTDLKLMANELTLRLGGMMIACVGLTAALVTFLDQVVFK